MKVRSLRGHSGSRSDGVGGGAAGHEWVGGRFTLPCYISEGEPYRPQMVLWFELPDGLVVGNTLIDPSKPPPSFASTLRQAMRAPMVGPARRPVRVRVADPLLAAELREAGLGIEVRVAPTPELDEVLTTIRTAMEADAVPEPTYLEGGRISAQVVEEFLRAAEALYGIAPWDVMSDDDVMRLDIPALGVERACLSVIGGLKEATGFLIFSSVEIFEEFARAAEACAARGHKGHFDLRGPILALNFMAGAELPKGARREIAKHGWPVAGPSAYPWLDHYDCEGKLAPLSERDYRVATACAVAFYAFFLKHRGLFKRGSYEPICESWINQNDLEVRFTVPYQAASMFACNTTTAGGLGPGAPWTRPATRAQAEPAREAKIGRNSPCPCGSGRKYKNCCLGKEDKVPRQDIDSEGRPAAVHKLDERLVFDMVEFAVERFGNRWRRAERDFRDAGAALQLFLPWSVYQFTVGGKPIVKWFLDEEGHRLSSAENSWLKAQEDAWLSVWEVLSAEPGCSLLLRDLLTGEEQLVHEVGASKTLVLRDAILARVVTFEDAVPALCGLHPNPLPPVSAAAVVDCMRQRLRSRRPIEPGRLRQYKTSRYLIACWEEEVERFKVRQSTLPVLKNSDGDDLLLTTDHFEFEPSARGEIEQRLALVEGVQLPEPEETRGRYTFIRAGNPKYPDWENTVIGTAELSQGKLRLETNSRKRADALRRRIESACEGLLRHRARVHKDPVALLEERREAREQGGEEERPAENQPPELQALTRQSKERHYAVWPDQHLPALGGKTPRQAVRTKRGRAIVDLIIKQCENSESRLPEAERFDFSQLRRELGLDE